MGVARKATPETPVAGLRVLVTGASSGIGLACAHELTARGARVALLARGGEALDEVARDLGHGAVAVVADVTDVAATRSALAEAAARLGGLDAVIANAGAGAYGPFVDMDPEDYRRTVETTLLGVINTAHAALPHLTSTGGTLVAVGSVAGRVPTPWLAAYTAAKHGVRGFVRTLSAELGALGSPVQVALVAPGPVSTPFWKRVRTTDGRLPPELRGTYRADDVAGEIMRALASPRTERTVGGLMAAWVALDALAPNLTLPVTRLVARLGWRNRRERPPSPPGNALEDPVEEPAVDGGLRARGSLLVKLRDMARVGR